MLVAGVMSGTSADGIDVAVVRLMGRGFRTRFQLLSHKHFEYPATVRRAVLEAMNAENISVADISRLNFLLGELYAEAVANTARGAGTNIELVGCHGQTIYHQGVAKKFLGRDVTCTWQTGEGAVIAERVGVPVVSDFRVADMAAGGQGAPLVPYLDFLLYRHARRGRIGGNRPRAAPGVAVRRRGASGSCRRHVEADRSTSHRDGGLARHSSSRYRRSEPPGAREGTIHLPRTRSAPRCRYDRLAPLRRSPTVQPSPG